MAKPWSNPKFAVASDRYDRTQAELAPVERRFEDVGERRFDYAGSKELESLKPRLDALFAARDAWARSMAVEEEIERIINDLIPELEARRRRLEARFEAITARPDTLSDAEFLDYRAENRAVEHLRAVVFEVTRLPEYAREWDAVLALKSFWFDLNRERARLFDKLLSPTMRPRHEILPWADAVRRLSELRTVEARSTLKEESHA